jgi:hypothetical protein
MSLISFKKKTITPPINTNQKTIPIIPKSIFVYVEPKITSVQKIQALTSKGYEEEFVMVNSPIDNILPVLVYIASAHHSKEKM